MNYENFLPFGGQSTTFLAAVPPAGMILVFLPNYVYKKSVAICGSDTSISVVLLKLGIFKNGSVCQKSQFRFAG